MISLIYNLKGVLTPSPDPSTFDVEVHDNAGILIQDDTIVEIADGQQLHRKYPEARPIDGQGCWAIPGFVDPHTHPIFYRTRQKEFVMRTQGKTYEAIAAAGGGIRNSVRAFRQASDDEIAELTYHRLMKFLEYGTTTIEAKSGYGLSVKDEIRSLRILKALSKLVPLTIVPTFLGAHEIPDEYRNNREKYIEIVIKEMIPQVAEEQLARYCDVFCEENVFTVPESEKILQAALDHGLKLRIHADELAYTGGAELAARLKATSADHLLNISDEGIAALKQAGVTPILLPGTAFFLGKAQYAPARKMISQGLPVALATDFNPGSSMTHNMQFILTLATIYMNMTPSEALTAATRNAALSLELQQTLGTIHPNKKADIVLMKIEDLDYLPYHYAVNHVHTVIRHGRVVFQSP